MNKTKLNNATQNTLWAALSWGALTLIVLGFWGGTKYLLAGSLTMLFCVTIIYYAVKSIMAGRNLILSIFLMFSKYPVIALSMYWLFKQPDFNVTSYALGLLNVLPSLVILSYRRPIN
ncbi:MAG: hypothetical protein M9899_01250 [Bdellovibrionaceae bacterium]|nr:hypothetical protein [Pseudobdellovibrionaceae bacterium]